MGLISKEKIDWTEPSFGGWSITEALYNYIRKVLPEGGTILELGSGYGTHQLSQYYKMYSIEHDEEFLDKYKSTYLYCPLKEHKAIANHEGTTWYDADKLGPQLTGLEYDLLLVDGPPRTRAGLVKYFDLFDPTVIIIFDDYERDIERKVVNSIASKLGCSYVVHGNGEGKPFGVINDPIFG